MRYHDFAFLRGEVFLQSKDCGVGPWPDGLAGQIVIPYTKRLRVRFPIMVHS